MALEDLNIYLFHCINAFAAKSPIFDSVVVFLAEHLNTVFIGFLLLLLVMQWKTYRSVFTKALLIVLMSLMLSECIDLFYHHPRPFQLEQGHKLIGHGASSSFPSQHTLTIVIVAFAYFMEGFKKLGVMGLVLSSIVGLSRIYAGVHFPFDILGSFMIGFVLVVATNAFLKEFAARVRKFRSTQTLD